MSMHKKPLTNLERAGLEAHGLPIGKPSQLSDCFRSGVAWSQQHIAELEEREASLAAYLDRLSRAIEACMSNDERKFVFSPDDYLELEHALDATFSESLARRDALNKAGAMDWVLAQSCNEENEGVMWRTKIVEPEIQRLRQQANQC